MKSKRMGNKKRDSADDVIDDDKLMEMIDKNAKYTSIERKKRTVPVWPKFDYKGEGLSSIEDALSPHDVARQTI